MNNFLHRGVTITHKKRKGATRIEVDSEAFNSDPIYNDVTLDTEIDRNLTKTFYKICNPF